MHYDKKKIKGSISLTTVILVGALLVVSGMAVLSNAMDVALSTKSYFNRILADTRVSSCLEEGMYKLTKNPTFNGNVTLTYPDGSCQVVIADNGTVPNSKSLTITATFESYTVTRLKYVTTNTSPMTLSN